MRTRWTELNGEANNYTSTEPILGLKYASRKLIIDIKFFSASTAYAKTDPIFNQKRQDEKIGSSIFIVFPGAFANNNLSLSMGATKDETDSNITFFDTAQEIYFIALGFRI